MSRLRRLAAVLSDLAVAASLSSCGGSSGSKGGASSGGAAKVTLKVYAAASLTESFGEIKKSYEAAHPNVKIVYTFAGSQDLVDQLSNGASGDVLATADEPTMEKAAKEGLAGEQRKFASNTLVLITPKGNPAGVKGLDSSLGGAKLVICAKKEKVPCGTATHKLAQKLGVTLKPVSEEQKVTDVRGKVEAGEADAGIVYRTDAVASGKKVDTIEIPGADQIVNTYPIAPVKASEHAAEAKEFVDYVMSAEGQKSLKKYGFGSVK